MNDLVTQIQLLIDGELSDSDRQKLLRYIDEVAPENWRHLALGFVERQILSSMLKKRQATTSKVIPFVKWGRLAAVLALGFGLGFLVTQGGKSPSESAPLAENRVLKPSDYDKTSAGATPSNDIKIPIVEIDQNPESLRRILHDANRPVRKAQQELIDSGMNPEIHTAFISTQLENGNQLVVPINYLGTRN